MKACSGERVQLVRRRKFVVGALSYLVRHDGDDKGEGDDGRVDRLDGVAEEGDAVADEPQRDLREEDREEDQVEVVEDVALLAATSRSESEALAIITSAGKLPACRLSTRVTPFDLEIVMSMKRITA